MKDMSPVSWSHRPQHGAPAPLPLLRLRLRLALLPLQGPDRWRKWELQSRQQAVTSGVQWTSPSVVQGLICKPGSQGRFLPIRPVVTIGDLIQLMKWLIRCRTLCYRYSPLRSKNIQSPLRKLMAWKKYKQTSISFFLTWVGISYTFLSNQKGCVREYKLLLICTQTETWRVRTASTTVPVPKAW